MVLTSLSSRAALIVPAFLSVLGQAAADEVMVNSWQDAVGLVQSGLSDATIYLDFAEDRCDPQMVIENVSRLKIVGRGQGLTTIHVDRETPDCIRISDNVANLQISSFSILGAIGKADAPDNGNAVAEHAEANRPGPKNPGAGCDRMVHRGISTAQWVCRLNASDVSNYAQNVSQVFIDDMEIAFLTTAINVQGSQPHPISDVDIRRSKIHHIRGTASGVGYGIQTSWTPRLLIYRNDFFRVGRHSIYVGLGGISEADRILVQSNTVTDGGFDDPSSIMQVCIAVARTAFVTVKGNKVQRCYTHAMSVERDEGGRISVSGVVLAENEFIATYPGRREIWINLDDRSPAGAVFTKGNKTSNGSPARIFGTLEPYVTLD